MRETVIISEPDEIWKGRTMILKDRYEMTQDENVFCAKRILVDSVYKQANLEGIAVTYAQTVDILNDVNAKDLTPTEISKVCCLRDGWHYLLDNLSEPINLAYLENIHEIIARFDVDYRYLGKPRVDDVLITGTDWRPEIPNFDTLHTQLAEHLKNENMTDRAFRTGLWMMRVQPFKDGNKRVGSFLINRILIENGRGIFNVPVEKDGIFKQMLVDYYVSEDMDALLEFCRSECMNGVNEIKDS